jgi:uncharacterized protein YkwD
VTGRRLLGFLVCASALLGAPHAHAKEIVELVNSIRVQGCGGRPGVQIEVERSETLDEVARTWSQGGRLPEAIDRVGYPMSESGSIYIEGTTDRSGLMRLLGTRHCAAVNNPDYTEIGVYRFAAGTWVVLAQPLALPDAHAQADVAQEVLALVNAARAQARRCGFRRHAAVAPLALSPALSGVALAHARDMAAQGKLEHRGADGSRPDERVTRAGYAWRTTGENIAAGQRDAQAAVAHWLKSAGHCANIMNPQFTQLGVGFAVDGQGGGRAYWAQVFATPR